MQLTKNFALSEFEFSQTAIRHELNNSVPIGLIPEVRLTANDLQFIRDEIERPIILTSGYRGVTLNNQIGGSSTSAHCYGMAADIKALGMTPMELFLAIKDMPLQFDQLILEFGRWVHYGRARPNAAPRRELLQAIKQDGETVYIPYRN